MGQRSSYDVIVVGGGMVGCATAGALAQRGYRVLVLEARSGTVHRFSGELIHPPGATQLERVGLLEPLRAAGGIDVRGFHVDGVPEEPGTSSLLHYADIPGIRPAGFAIHHPTMVDALRAELATRPGVELRLGAKVHGVLRHTNGAGPRVQGVRLSTGEELTAGLVVAADGRHSQMRDHLGLPVVTSRHLSFTAGVLLEDGNELLPNPGYAHIFLGAWGPILAYPVSAREVRLCFDLPVDVPKGSAQVAARLLEAYVPHMPSRLAQATRDALARRPPEMAANYHMSTDHCVVPGAVLVGDAAGCLHPLTASGMTVGLNDGRLLAQLPSFELPDLLTYEQERYRFGRVREILADALYEVFCGHDAPTRAIRRGILHYWNHDKDGRATSMALLAAAESRLSVFMQEYLTVVRFSARAISGDGEPLLQRLNAFFGLGKKSYEKLDLVGRALRDHFRPRAAGH